MQSDKPRQEVKKNGPIILITLITFASLSDRLKAQDQGALYSQHEDLSGYILHKHSLDQTLINGVGYYDKYPNVSGHPFLFEDSQPGSITLSGKVYEDLLINYDLYSQHLVLEYMGRNKSYFKIILSPAHTGSFRMNDEWFQKLDLGDKRLLFYQVIGTDELKLFVHHEKLLTGNTGDQQFLYRFSDPKMTYYLEYMGNIFPIKNKRSLAEVFSGSSKGEIRKYMKKNILSFQHMTPGELHRLIDFISSLNTSKP